MKEYIETEPDNNRGIVNLLPHTIAMSDAIARAKQKTSKFFSMLDGSLIKCGDKQLYDICELIFMHHEIMDAMSDVLNSIAEVNFTFEDVLHECFYKDKKTEI